MTAIEKAIAEYVQLRGSLGFRMAGANHLRAFAKFLKERNERHITTRLAVEWATCRPNTQPAYWALRLSTVRQFARYLSLHDPKTEIPPSALLPMPHRRKPPYLYTEEEIRQILDAARRLRSALGLVAANYSTLIGLMVVTGLRTSEVVALRDDDVDLAAGILHVRLTKFRKSRFVPLHPSSTKALQHYRTLRDRLVPRRRTSAFFAGERGAQLYASTVQDVFRQLCHGLPPRPECRRAPRLHDFRHRLAITTVVGWYRRGVDVERYLPALSTFLGHSQVTHTYWYLTAVPELLRLATDRLHLAGGAQCHPPFSRRGWKRSSPRD